MPMPKNKIKKPLTLDELAEYNQEVLFPALEERFATKNDLRQMKEEIKEETRDGVEKLLIKADKILKKMDDKETEEASGLALYKRHDQKLDDHEARIAKLEIKV
ncbi:MAG: hypothetical protein HYT20_02945 [Candidatus Nealsonbacteria bacterium]|nr:hypothetical protein [Candidatus Nealsonbacteria bacterium]